MRIDADGKDIEEARMVVVKRVDKFCFFVIFVGSVSNYYQPLLHNPCKIKTSLRLGFFETSLSDDRNDNYQSCTTCCPISRCFKILKPLSQTRIFENLDKNLYLQKRRKKGTAVELELE